VGGLVELCGERPRGDGDAVSPYLGIVFLLAIAAGFVALTIITSLLVGPGRYNRAKYDSYECGIEPTPQPVGGGRFPVKFYLTAMLFIIFDIEIIFLYPWAVSFDALGMFGFVEMVLFILTVFIAYAYVWRRGGLDWD
jgi:NADH-quinone oxidoreductase subunit A